MGYFVLTGSLDLGKDHLAWAAFRIGIQFINRNLRFWPQSDQAAVKKEDLYTGKGSCTDVGTILYALVILRDLFPMGAI